MNDKFLKQVKDIFVDSSIFNYHFWDCKYSKEEKNAYQVQRKWYTVIIYTVLATVLIVIQSTNLSCKRGDPVFWRLLYKHMLEETLSSEDSYLNTPGLLYLHRKIYVILFSPVYRRSTFSLTNSRYCLCNSRFLLSSSGQSLPSITSIIFFRNGSCTLSFHFLWSISFFRKSMTSLWLT